uniref:Uncharacterized protein n=1 Tax=Caenorhabditis japonica TaxID=281687 RepID=A0A8R1EGD6_CAEJA
RFPRPPFDGSPLPSWTFRRSDWDGGVRTKLTEVEDVVRLTDHSARRRIPSERHGQPIRTGREHRPSLWQGGTREDVMYGTISRTMTAPEADTGWKTEQ